MNRFQLRLRAVSDSHLAGEMDVCDRALGEMTVGEAIGRDDLGEQQFAPEAA